MSNAIQQPTKARLASLDQLLADVVPNYLSPVPARDTFRVWLDNWKISRFKANPLSKRGGGTVWYSVSQVEQVLKARVLPKVDNRTEEATA